MSFKSKENNIKKSQYLTFILKEELFGLEVLPIKEITKYLNITKVPMMPKFVKGVTNVRGKVIPVIDLSERLGLGEVEVARKTCMVIVESGQNEDKYEMGILIDAIHQVLELENSDLEKTPNFGTKVDSRFIGKMGKVTGKFINLLNLETILNIEELSTVVNV